MRRSATTLRPFALAAVLLAVPALAACGGDSSSSAPAATEAADTSAPAADTAGGTTEAPPADTAADTVAPEATDPPAEFVSFTTDDLLAALPTVADLGDGWTELVAEPLVSPEAKEGFGVGACGGPNGAARAAQTGVEAVVLSSVLQQADQRRVSTAIYTFPDDTSAQAFLDLTAEVVDCPDGVTWELVQRANPTAENEYNGFGPGYEDITDGKIWSFTEVGQHAFAEGDTSVLLLSQDKSRELTAADIVFSQIDTTLTQYDRYDNVVIVTQLQGTWEYKGYLNLDQLVAYQPTVDDLTEYASVVTPLVLERLGWDPTA